MKINKLENLHNAYHREVSTMAFSLARSQKLYRDHAEARRRYRSSLKLIETETQKVLLADHNAREILEAIKKEVSCQG